MSYTIVFSDAHKGEVLLTQKYSELCKAEEINTYCQSARRITVLEALLYPVRTHTRDGFCCDLLIPLTATLHAVFRVKTAAQRIFLCLLSLVCLSIDAITFPVRLLTTIPRCIYNRKYTKEQHPLYKYLLASGITKATLIGDIIRLDWNYITSSGQAALGDLKGFKQILNSPKLHAWTTTAVGLIPLPLACTHQYISERGLRQIGTDSTGAEVMEEIELPNEPESGRHGF